MTCREKLKIEHPDKISANGSCYGCPKDYGYLPDNTYDCDNCSCEDCWDQLVITSEMLDILEPSMNVAIEYALDLISNGASVLQIDTFYYNIVQEIMHRIYEENNKIDKGDEIK